MADKVDVIEFVKMAGVFMTGDRAGFEPGLAQEYVKRGFAKLVSSGVDRIAADVQATDALRRVMELRAMIASAERDAKTVAKTPEGAAVAAQALEIAAQANAGLDALTKVIEQLGLDKPAGRKPAPESKAA